MSDPFDPHKIADRLDAARGDPDAMRAVAADVAHAATARLLSDEDLVAAFQRTDGEPGNPEADALLAEISLRGLDI